MSPNEYADRQQAVEDAIAFAQSMKPKPTGSSYNLAPATVDLFDVLEIARFLLKEDQVAADDAPADLLAGAA